MSKEQSLPKAWGEINTLKSGKLDKSGGEISDTLKIGNNLIIGSNSIVDAKSFGNGLGQTPTISLAIGDSDTGFNWLSDGNVEAYANNTKLWNLKDVYHTGKKPTPADIGAVNKTGDTLSGINIFNRDGYGILLRPLTAGTSSYILGQNHDGVDNFFIGRGAVNSNNLSLYSYATGNILTLESDKTSFSKRLNFPGGDTSSDIYFNHCGKMRIGGADGWIGITNKANTAWKHQFYENGNATITGNVVSYGHYDLSGHITANSFISSSNGIKLRIPHIESGESGMETGTTAGIGVFLGGIFSTWYGNKGMAGFFRGSSTDIGEFRVFHNGSSSLRFMLATGSLISSGPMTQNSDIRLKKDLLKIPNSLEKISELNGYTYTMKETGVKQTGVVAQEVGKVLPEAVILTTRDNGEEVLSVAYGNMVGLLIEGIKELKTINELQSGKIKNLEEKISNLEQLNKEKKWKRQ